jgi:hypothetical protein
MPFGEFDSTRSGWLVLHEARLCIELGPGDVALFPSSVFTHSNTAIHADDKRNSLAFWCGASLFLWLDLGMRSFESLSGCTRYLCTHIQLFRRQADELVSAGQAEKKRVWKGNREDWRKAWERFPVL